MPFRPVETRNQGTKAQQGTKCLFKSFFYPNNTLNSKKFCAARATKTLKKSKQKYDSDKSSKTMIPRKIPKIDK